MGRHETATPSRPASQVFLVGKNRTGNWVVQDQRALRGELFVSRTEALRFAKSHSGTDPAAIIIVPGGLELEMGGAASPPRGQAPAGRLIFAPH